MTTTAVIFLVLSAVLVWGGLVASIIRLRHDGRHEVAEPTAEPGPEPDRTQG